MASPKKLILFKLFKVTAKDLRSASAKARDLVRNRNVRVARVHLSSVKKNGDKIFNVLGQKRLRGV